MSIGKSSDKEMEKVWDDVKKDGFGIFDSEKNMRVNPNTLAFFWAGENKKKLREEVALRRDLMIIDKIYKEKFGSENPYELNLFEKDVGLFVERLIRAVEICTMNYVLNMGGALNNYKGSTIIKGRKKFVWEC